MQTDGRKLFTEELTIQFTDSKNNTSWFIFLFLKVLLLIPISIVVTKCLNLLVMWCIDLEFKLFNKIYVLKFMQFIEGIYEVYDLS